MPLKEKNQKTATKSTKSQTQSQKKQMLREIETLLKKKGSYLNYQLDASWNRKDKTWECSQCLVTTPLGTARVWWEVRKGREQIVVKFSKEQRNRYDERITLKQLRVLKEALENIRTTPTSVLTKEDNDKIVHKKLILKNKILHELTGDPISLKNTQEVLHTKISLWVAEQNKKYGNIFAVNVHRRTSVYVLKLKGYSEEDIAEFLDLTLSQVKSTNSSYDEKGKTVHYPVIKQIKTLIHEFPEEFA